VIPLLVLLALLAQEAPALRLVSTKIWAPNQTIKPIFVTLNVRNESPQPVGGAIARVVLTPMYRTGQRGVAPGGAREPVTTMFEPWTLEAPVPLLAPGQARTLVLETPFLARSAFSTSGRTFTVENLIPNLKRTVPIHVDVELILTPPSSG
jgi:hypothetical protein